MESIKQTRFKDERVMRNFIAGKQLVHNNDLLIVVVVVVV